MWRWADGSALEFSRREGVELRALMDRGGPRGVAVSLAARAGGAGARGRSPRGFPISRGECRATTLMRCWTRMR